MREAVVAAACLAVLAACTDTSDLERRIAGVESTIQVRQSESKVPVVADLGLNNTGGAFVIWLIDGEKFSVIVSPGSLCAREAQIGSPIPESCRRIPSE